MGFLQIRATNTDVNDGSQWLSGVSLPLSTTDLFTEFLHMLQLFIDPWHDILSIDFDWTVAGVPEGNVQYSSIFGGVDLLAIEHGISQFLNLCFLANLDEKFKRLLSQKVLGKVEERLGAIGRVVERERELLETGRVFFELFL